MSSRTPDRFCRRLVCPSVVSARDACQEYKRGRRCKPQAAGRHRGLQTSLQRGVLPLSHSLTTQSIRPQTSQCDIINPKLKKQQHSLPFLLPSVSNTKSIYINKHTAPQQRLPNISPLIVPLPQGNSIKSGWRTSIN